MRGGTRGGRETRAEDRRNAPGSSAVFFAHELLWPFSFRRQITFSTSPIRLRQYQSNTLEPPNHLQFSSLRIRTPDITFLKIGPCIDTFFPLEMLEKTFFRELGKGVPSPIPTKLTKFSL